LGGNIRGGLKISTQVEVILYIYRYSPKSSKEGLQHDRENILKLGSHVLKISHGMS
jgi:hypothetical protein